MVHAAVKGLRVPGRPLPERFELHAHIPAARAQLVGYRARIVAELLDFGQCGLDAVMKFFQLLEI